MHTPTFRRFTLALTLSVLGVTAGCDQPPDWDAQFDIDPWQDGRRSPATSDRPQSFEHQGTWTGVCRMSDREPFQVELHLDSQGSGDLVRHDMALSHLAAAGRSDADGMSVVMAMHEELAFRAHLWTDEHVVVGNCFELAPADAEMTAEGAADAAMMPCNFPEIGCPATPEAYEVMSVGELVLVRTN